MSILKPRKPRQPLQAVNLPINDEEEDTTEVRHRRVSFAGVNKIKEFNSEAESVVICDTPAYEEEFTASSDSSQILRNLNSPCVPHMKPVIYNAGETVYNSSSLDLSCMSMRIYSARDPTPVRYSINQAKNTASDMILEDDIICRLPSTLMYSKQGDVQDNFDGTQDSMEMTSIILPKEDSPVKLSQIPGPQRSLLFNSSLHNPSINSVGINICSQGSLLDMDMTTIGNDKENLLGRKSVCVSEALPVIEMSQLSNVPFTVGSLSVPVGRSQTNHISRSMDITEMMNPMQRRSDHYSSHLPSVLKASNTHNQSPAHKRYRLSELPNNQSASMEFTSVNHPLPASRVSAYDLHMDGSHRGVIERSFPSVSQFDGINKSSVIDINQSLNKTNVQGANNEQEQRHLFRNDPKLSSGDISFTQVVDRPLERFDHSQINFMFDNKVQENSNHPIAANESCRSMDLSFTSVVPLNEIKPYCIAPQVAINREGTSPFDETEFKTEDVPVKSGTGNPMKEQTYTQRKSICKDAFIAAQILQSDDSCGGVARQSIFNRSTLSFPPEMNRTECKRKLDELKKGDQVDMPLNNSQARVNVVYSSGNYSAHDSLQCPLNESFPACQVPIFEMPTAIPIGNDSRDIENKDEGPFRVLSSENKMANHSKNLIDVSECEMHSSSMEVEELSRDPLIEVISSPQDIPFIGESLNYQGNHDNDPLARRIEEIDIQDNLRQPVTRRSDVYNIPLINSKLNVLSETNNNSEHDLLHSTLDVTNKDENGVELYKQSDHSEPLKCQNNKIGSSSVQISHEVIPPDNNRIDSFNYQVESNDEVPKINVNINEIVKINESLMNITCFTNDDSNQVETEENMDQIHGTKSVIDTLSDEILPGHVFSPLRRYNKDFMEDLGFHYFSWTEWTMGFFNRSISLRIKVPWIQYSFQTPIVEARFELKEPRNGTKNKALTYCSAEIVSKLNEMKILEQLKSLNNYKQICTLIMNEIKLMTPFFESLEDLMLYYPSEIVNKRIVFRIVDLKSKINFETSINISKWESLSANDITIDIRIGKVSLSQVRNIFSFMPPCKEKFYEFAHALEQLVHK